MPEVYRKPGPRSRAAAPAGSLTGSPPYGHYPAMRFGIFGSAQARRGGPDVDSGAGFRDFVQYNTEAEALGFHITFVV